MKPILFACAALLGCAAPSARAWDAGGHMIVAQIAYGHLSPKAKRKAQALVPLAPDLRLAKKKRAYDFVSLAAWMDDVRASKQREALSKLHYIDIECGHEPGDVKEENALHALESARIVLRSEAPAKEKAEWLAVALHVAGDLHQPLHASERDRGGNDYAVLGVPGVDKRIARSGKPVDRDEPRTGDNTPAFQRLHAVWDLAYRIDAAPVGASKLKMLLYDLGTSETPNLTRLKRISRDIEKRYLPQRPFITSDPAVWASESNTIACDWVFSTPKRQSVSAEYLERSHDVACSRLALAGVRLAAWLNETLGDERR
jgi:hypothetical protein